MFYFLDALPVFGSGGAPSVPESSSDGGGGGDSTLSSTSIPPALVEEPTTPATSSFPDTTFSLDSHTKVRAP